MSLEPRATTEQPAVRPRTRTKTEVLPETEDPGWWTLVLLDDSAHSYDYVIEMLGSIFGHGAEKAFSLARLVDTQGRAAVLTANHEECLEGQTKIHGYGADPRIPASKGSMSAIIEPAP